MARRWWLAGGIYLAVTAVVLLTAGSERIAAHTPYNHYALQAAAWLDGRLALAGEPPRYTGHNDFAFWDGRWFVSFPPLPALLLLPFVALAGSAEAVPDGLVFMLLSGAAPALLFLALERLRDDRRSERSQGENVRLALLFAFGTVYWFSAVQGTVWFAGHVVGSALLCGYVWCSIGAARPIAAGLCLALAFATRPTLGFALPFFGYELWRLEKDRLRRALRFALPAAAVLALLAWHNQARFGDPLEFGHRLLVVRWRERIDRYGLFSFHFLEKNLRVVLGGMPFHRPKQGWQINGHGLALWLTSPFYPWALWPRRPRGLFWACAASVLFVAIPNFLYQNTGWIQFGYRFSNDFAPLLFVLIALGARKLSPAFWLLAGAAVVINGFGALTFDRAEHRHFYFIDGTQEILGAPP